MKTIHRQLLFFLALTLSMLGCVWGVLKARADSQGCPPGMICGNSNYYCSAETMGRCNICSNSYCTYNGISGSPKE